MAKEAARCDKLDCLQHLIEHGFNYNVSTINEAMSHSIDCLRFLHQLDPAKCIWTPDVSCKAAGMGNLECLKFAFENGCKLHEKTVYYAVQNDQLECAKYAIMNGVKFNIDTYLSIKAKILGCVRCTLWRKSEDGHIIYGCNIVDKRCKHIDFWKWLVERHIVEPHDMDEILSYLNDE